MFPLAPSGLVLFTSHKKIFVTQKLNVKQTEWLPHIDNRNMEVHVWQGCCCNICLGHFKAALQSRCCLKPVAQKK